MNKFARNFMAALREDCSEVQSESCRSTFRADKLGNRVEVPYGGTYKVGRNNRAKGIRKGNTAKEDRLGQIHELKPGEVLKLSSTGRGTAVCPGESTSEKNGQIVVNRKRSQGSLVKEVLLGIALANKLSR